MTLRIVVEQNRSREKRRHSFLLGDRKERIGERTGRSSVLDGPQCLAHQVDAHKISGKSGCGSYRDLNFAKCLKNRGVVFATQKCRIDLGGDKRVQLGLGKQACLAVGFKVLLRPHALSPSGNEEPGSGLVWVAYQNSFALQPGPGLHERSAYQWLFAAVFRLLAASRLFQRAHEVALAD